MIFRYDEYITKRWKQNFEKLLNDIGTDKIFLAEQEEWSFEAFHGLILKKKF